MRETIHSQPRAGNHDGNYIKNCTSVFSVFITQFAFSIDYTPLSYGYLIPTILFKLADSYLVAFNFAQ